MALTPTQQAFLNRARQALENPPVLILTPEQIAAKEAYDALTDAEKTILAFHKARLSLLKQSIATVASNWLNIWENSEISPADMLAAMGTEAVSIFQSSAAFTQAIYDIGQLMTPPVELDPKYLSAALPYEAHADGTITLVGE